MKKVTYCPIGEIQQRFGVYLTGAGFEKTAPGETYPHDYHTSDYYFTWKNGRILADWEYQILYIRSGRGVIEFERGQSIKVSSGTLILLRPGEWHRYRPDLQTGWEEAYIGIGGRLLESIACPPFFTERHTVVPVADPESFEKQLYPLIEKIKSASAEHPYSLSLETLALLARVSESRYARNTSIGHNADIRKATVYIAHHLAEVIDFADLARKYSMGYTLFRRLFRAYTGLAPLEYQTSLRIRRATHLLTSTDIPVEQIATDTGFASPAYFSRYFRLRLNLSPTEYRKIHSSAKYRQSKPR